MVLKPLEFSDCLTDNPWFRQNIAEHENALEKSYKTIKLLENQCREMISAAHKRIFVHYRKSRIFSDLVRLDDASCLILRQVEGDIYS
uniref:BAR domain-containing protein n=1 Tax=Romanomermis culicivorax TaxID=13658 RepID=A0A915HHT7_ROMCU